MGVTYTCVISYQQMSLTSKESGHFIILMWTDHLDLYSIKYDNLKLPFLVVHILRFHVILIND